jgi:hypothetical protein
VQPPSTQYRPSAANHEPTEEAFPAPAVRELRVGALDTDSDERTGGSQVEASCSRNG